MSSFKIWWEKRTSREKTLLLLFLIIMNILLFFQLNNNFSSEQATVNTPPPPPTVTAAQTPSKGVLPAAETIPGTVLRNPFQPPAGLTPVEPSRPAGTPSNHYTGNGNIPADTHAKATVPLPRLTGIITSESGKKLAIVEYNGTSRYYGLYDEIGAFNISAISATGITLSGPDGSRQLTLRR